ncbi:MAG: RtcB family protein [Clostridia bacterium]|nr:RtcB family protein [Clostridia bacterium]
MRICQEFASLNRQTIADKIIKCIGVNNVSQFETVHNFIDDKNIIRKGSIPAYKGQKVIIPMNMRDGCLVAVGKGNEDWNYSAPHGAGRLFKRSETHDLISMEEYSEQMKGIYSSTVNEHSLDEAPLAYKPMKEIIDLIGDTVEIIDIIKPIYNFKAEK